MFFYNPSTPSPPPSQPPLLQHQTQWQVLDERLIDEKNNEGFEVPQCLPCACDVMYVYAMLAVCVYLSVCLYALHSDTYLRVCNALRCLYACISVRAMFMRCCLYAMHSDACMQCTHMPVCNARRCLYALH